MNFFRRLDAALSGELLAAQVATTSRTAETAGATPTVDTEAWEQVDMAPYRDVFAALALHADNPGVIEHTAMPFPSPRNHEGEN